MKQLTKPTAEFNPTTTKFNITSSKPTENAKGNSGYCQPDSHRPEFSGVICVQPGVVSINKKEAKTTG